MSASIERKAEEKGNKWVKEKGNQRVKEKSLLFTKWKNELL